MLLKEQIKKTQILGKHSKNEKKSLFLNFPGTFSQLNVNSKDTRMTFKYVFLRFLLVTPTEYLLLEDTSVHHL